jgi:hypothetical protein
MGVSLVRSSSIVDLWRTNIFESDAIKAITHKTIYHDITQETLKEVANLRHNQKINFFAFTVRRAIEPLMGEKFRLYYFAQCNYTIWADPDGANWVSCIDAIETLQEQVINVLGGNWLGNVASYEEQQGPPDVAVGTIAEERVFSARYNYQAFICSV